MRVEACCIDQANAIDSEQVAILVNYLFALRELSLVCLAFPNDSC